MGAVALDVGLLRRRRDFGLLVAGQTVSGAGSFLTVVALPFQVYTLTRSSLAVGLLGLAEFVPIVGLGLVGGALADAVDRRRMVQGAELAAALVALVLVANALLDDPHVSVLYVAAALNAACIAALRPSLDALVPRLVAREELKAAAAIEFAAHNTAAIGGPVLGGVLIASAGLPATYAIDAAAIVVALTSGWTSRVRRHGRAVVYAAGAWGVAITGFGLVDALVPALVLLAIAGGMDAVSGVFRSVMWNETIPDRLRGRLAGIELISFASGPTLGTAEAGVVAALAGVRASVVSGGVACVAGCAVLAVALPRFWAYDSRDSAEGFVGPARNYS